MIWHIGHFYRLSDLVELLNQKPSRPSSLFKYSPMYRGVDTKQLVELGIAGKWIQTDSQNNLVLTPQGQEFLTLKNPVLRLRNQIRTLIEILRPSWASITGQGRKAFIQYAPPEVVQCFREAGILDSFDEDAITWWDSLAVQFWKEHELHNVAVGRAGERLSYLYECDRTGIEPHWIALEYEGAGYDIVSQVSTEDTTPLLIEVKASSKRWEHARFYITRNEWDVLRLEQHAVFHLWCISEQQKGFASISTAEIAPHISQDKGSGKWKLLECPYSPFISSKVASSL